MQTVCSLKETHDKLKGSELERLYHAMRSGEVLQNVFFATNADDPCPKEVEEILLGAYCRASDPMETSVSPICGYNSIFEKMQLVMHGNTGEILIRKTEEKPTLDGWKPPVAGQKLYAFVPKNFR